MNMRTALIGGVLVAVAVVLLIVFSGSEDDDGEPTTSGNAAAIDADHGGRTPSQKMEPPADAEIPTIVVGSDGKPAGGVAELTYQHGDEVRFRVKSAVADEIHVHGYDLMKDVEAGGTVSFAFPAEIEGLFEAELEGRGEQIVELKVEP